MPVRNGTPKRHRAVRSCACRRSGRVRGRVAWVLFSRKSGSYSVCSSASRPAVISTNSVSNGSRCANSIVSAYDRVSDRSANPMIPADPAALWTISAFSLSAIASARSAVIVCCASLKVVCASRIAVVSPTHSHRVPNALPVFASIKAVTAMMTAAADGPPEARMAAEAVDPSITGMEKWNRLPTPGSLSTESVPLAVRSQAWRSAAPPHGKDGTGR